ncbi:MAG: hypothetical protein WBO46_10515 [Caldilineaceae bacterium]
MLHMIGSSNPLYLLLYPLYNYRRTVGKLLRAFVLIRWEKGRNKPENAVLKLATPYRFVGGGTDLILTVLREICKLTSCDAFIELLTGGNPSKLTQPAAQ